MALSLFHRKEVTSDKPGRISWGRGRPRSQLLLHFVKCMRCLVANSLLNVRVYSHRWLAPSELAVHGPVHGHFFFAMSDVLQGVRARQLPWTEWQFLWCCWPFSATDGKNEIFFYHLLQDSGLIKEEPERMQEPNQRMEFCVAGSSALKHRL